MIILHTIHSFTSLSLSLSIHIFIKLSSLPYYYSYLSYRLETHHLKSLLHNYIVNLFYFKINTNIVVFF